MEVVGSEVKKTGSVGGSKGLQAHPIVLLYSTFVFTALTMFQVIFYMLHKG